MKTFAIQTDPAAVTDLDDLRKANVHIGHIFYHRPDANTGFLMVCHPKNHGTAEGWLSKNGWSVLPHVMDTGTTISAEHLKVLVLHDSSINSTDNTVQVMKKIVKNTKMECFSPFE